MTMYFVQPSDLLFFKDGREVQAGTEYSAEGLFPPLPTTFYGAIRSAIVAHQNGDFRADNFGLGEEVQSVVGTKTSETAELGDLSLDFFALASSKFDQDNNKEVYRIYYPAPRDFLQRKDADDNDEKFKPVQAGPIRQNLVQTNFPSSALQLNWALHPETAFLKYEERYLSPDIFFRYLSGEFLADENDKLVLRRHKDWYKAEDLFQKEPRMQIAVNQTTRTVQTSALFTIAYTRLNNNLKGSSSTEDNGDIGGETVGFLLRLNVEDLLPDQGWLRLGGESRPAGYKATTTESFKDSQVAEIKEKVKQTGRFKLILGTTAVFEHGWLPDGISPDGHGDLEGLPVQLRGATLGRPVTVGGWDLAAGRPKFSRRGVPPGSVYYFELGSDDVDRLFDRYFTRSVQKKDSDEYKQGLGITTIGVW